MAWGAAPHEVTETIISPSEAGGERRLACSCGWTGSRTYRIIPTRSEDDRDGVGIAVVRSW